LEEANNWIGFKDELARYLHRYKPETFMDYLFFIEIYSRSKLGYLSIEELYNRKFREHEIIDNILKDSHGFLLWDYHLENLIRLLLIEPNSERTTEIRRKLNVKDQAYWNLAKELKLSNGLCLYDILDERTILGCTSYPQFRFAYNLFQLIK
jgi:hypothetical protein